MNPLKPTLKSEIIPIIILIAVVIVTIVTYPMLPAQVASHWNFAGQVDSYMSKFWNAIMFPCLLVGMYILFLVMPKFDPRRERYAEFKGVYNIFRSAIMLILTAVYLATLAFNLGYPVSIAKIVSLLIGLMMIVLGNYMGKIKPNWFMGIRTPWTLSSETVWNKTHRFGGFLFIIFGVLLIVAPYLPEVLGMIALFGGIVMLIVGGFLYSYVIYRQEQKSK